MIPGIPDPSAPVRFLRFPSAGHHICPDRVSLPQAVSLPAPARSSGIQVYPLWLRWLLSEGAASGTPPAAGDAHCASGCAPVHGAARPSGGAEGLSMAGGLEGVLCAGEASGGRMLDGGCSQVSARRVAEALRRQKKNRKKGGLRFPAENEIIPHIRNQQRKRL